MRNKELRVYDGPGPTGELLATLPLDQGAIGNELLAFNPDYPAGATTYFFNLGVMLKLGRENPCTLFESETDYPVASPIRSVGADGLGNEIGQQVFKEKTYTFWITFNEKHYILPPPDHPDWETQIVCGIPKPQ